MLDFHVLELALTDSKANGTLRSVKMKQAGSAAADYRWSAPNLGRSGITCTIKQ